MKPFCAIYSTFQRGYDQGSDVANRACRSAIDRAALVGADGPTHAGSFDIGYLGAPGMVHGRRRGVEPARMVATARSIDDGPSASAILAARHRREIPEHPEPLEIGKGRIMREGSTVAIPRPAPQETPRAADILGARGFLHRADARFAAAGRGIVAQTGPHPRGADYGGRGLRAALPVRWPWPAAAF